MTFSYRPEVVENYSNKWVDKGTWIGEAVIYRHMREEVKVMVAEEICIHTKVVGMATVGMVMVVEGTCRHREVVGMVMVEE
nr:hypothetical protein [Tanacetum cinerariifolium]